MKKQTSKLIKEYLKKEIKDFKCAVCGKDLLTLVLRIKTMEFENGLIKNFIKEKKETEHYKYGTITEIDGSEIYLCYEHFQTAWAIKKPGKSFKEIVEYIKTNNLIVFEENNEAKNEVNKEITESVCNGNLEI